LWPRGANRAIRKYVTPKGGEKGVRQGMTKCDRGGEVQKHVMSRFSKNIDPTMFTVSVTKFLQIHWMNWTNRTW